MCVTKGVPIFLSLATLEAENTRLRAILESAIDFAVVATDPDGIITDWNSGAVKVMGWTADEMRGQDAERFFTPEDRVAGRIDYEMQRALQEGRASDERWHLKKDGQRFWASGEMMPLYEDGKGHTGFIKILRDRTEQRIAGAKLQADAAFMHSVLSSSADCIKVLDLDARLTFMNEGGMQVMEISDFNDVKGCPWPDFWAGQGNGDALAALEAARAGGTGHFQGMADTYLGTPKWWDVQVTTILGPDGAPDKLLAVSRDISDQKAVEGQLAASETRWRGLFDGMQEGFFLGELIRNAEGRATDYRFLEINPAFARQSGLPADSIGQTIRSFVPDIDQNLIDRYAGVVETGVPIAFEIDVPGLNRVFKVRANREQAERFSCLFLDISARRQADKRRAATTELGDHLRDADTVLEMTTRAADILGRTLKASRAGYGELDAACEVVTILQDGASPGEASVVGRHLFADYGAVGRDIERGIPVTVYDVTTDPRTAENQAAYVAINLRAMLNVPVQEHGRTVGLIFVHSPTARAWTPEEVAFARNVADRVQVGIARLRAEEQQTILNTELSHRMKNTLTLVQSIASQTLRNAENLTEAREALAARLIALGKAHDILLRGQTDGASIGAVIDGALALHEDAGGRFRCDGPNLPVGPSAALSLGLILHELATNASKYGALKRSQGYVDLTWRVEGRGPKAQIQLVWAEHGGPAVAAPTRKGLGSRLIQRGLAGGTVEMCYPVDGVVCTLTTPLASLKTDT